MELFAAIRGVELVEAVAASICVVTDSRYVHQGASVWLGRWQRRGWTLARGRGSVKNLDLWQRLDEAIRRQARPILWEWTPGHAGHVLNERCDRLASEQAALAGCL